MPNNELGTTVFDEKTVNEQANLEITRIFTILKISTKHEAEVMTKFKKLRRVLKPGTKYRIPMKLVPICVFFTLKLLDIDVDETKLLNTCEGNLTKNEFNNFKMQIQEFAMNMPGGRFLRKGE